LRLLAAQTNFLSKAFYLYGAVSAHPAKEASAVIVRYGITIIELDAFSGHPIKGLPRRKV
jgi:hypothetical protein